MMIGSAPLSARDPRTSLRAAGAVQMAAGGATAVGRNTNVLLTRDDVGTAKPCCIDLPNEHFTYGRPANQDLEGCREVSMRWVSHTPSAGPVPSAPDFVTFNRRATQSKVTNAKEWKHYRREHDVMASTVPSPRYPSAQPTPRGDTPGKSRSLPRPVMPPGFAYGRKVRPSTPIGDVISARFAEHHDRQMHRFYTDFRAEQELARTQVRKIPLTAASRGHATAAKRAQTQDDAPKELFKLKKFSRAATKIDNRRRRDPAFDPAAHSDYGDEDDHLPHGGEGFDMDPNVAARDLGIEGFEDY